MMLEIATFVLIVLLALILTLYNRRQARALEYMARLEEDRSAREIKDRRVAKASDLKVDPLRWLEGMVNPLLDAPIALTDTAKRVVPEVETIELRSADGRRLLVSSQELSTLRRFDRLTSKKNGHGASSRLSEFASTPLLGRNWRIWNAARTMADSENEFFDMEAEACGKSLGINWGTPTRLWFYVLPA